MNRKQFILLLVAVAVIGGVSLVLYNKKTGSYQGSTRTGQTILGTFDPNEVGHVTIKEGDKELNLVRGNDKWTVKERNNYPANFDQIAEFVRKMQDLKVVQTMRATPKQLEKLELSDKTGTAVQFKDDKGKALKSVRLGAKVMRQSSSQSPFGDDGGFPTGRHVMPEGSQTVAVVSDPLSSAEPKPEQWLNKDFFKVEKVKSISFASQTATNSWLLTRESESGDFKLADVKPGEMFDTNKVASFANALSSPSFSDVVVDKKPEETGLDKPETLTLTTFDHFTYTLKIGKKSGDDNYYATVSVSAELPKERTPGKDEKPEDKDKLDKEFKDNKEKLEQKLKQEQQYTSWTYTIPQWTLESILKPRAELMVKPEEKKEEPTAASAEKQGDIALP